MSDSETSKPRSNKSKRRSLLKWIKRSLWIAAALGLLAMIVVAFLPKPVLVDVVEVERGALRVTVDEDGRSRVSDRYVLSAPLTGNLGRIELDPGDDVGEGEVIARLVPLARPLMDAQSRAEAEARVAAAAAQLRQARASVERGRAALAFADTQVGRQRQLMARGTVAQVALDRAELEHRSRREEVTSAEFGVRVAAHQLEMARTALGRFDDGANAGEQMEVTSPIEGQVLRLLHESAGVVQAGTPLVELGDPSHLEIAVDVLTSDAVQITPGQRVIVERWGGDSLEGHVRLIEPSAFTRTSALGVEEQRINVVIDLDSPRDEWRRLGDGYRVETQIVIWEVDDALKVPANAVFRHDGGWAVYAIVDGVARLTSVETGRRNGLEVEVIGGLEEGARLVAHPSDQVSDGVPVEGR
ncbi:MAG: HlyD family efflux transporter periplasmic adaptor subunit [Sandaracinaceae bacterium]